MQINLNLGIWNANGLSNHVNEISLLLKTNAIDVMLVSETHFTSKSFFRVIGYDTVRADHPSDRAHGGAAIIVKQGLKFQIMDSTRENVVQAATIKIKCMHADVSITAIYLPPRFTIKELDFKNFFQGLGTKFIVGGDFNAKHPWWGSRLTNPKGSELYKCIRNNNITSLSTGKPTYWPTDSQKIPDLIDFVLFSGIPLSHMRVMESFDLNSDHSPIIATYSTIAHMLEKPYKVITASTDINAFKSYLESAISLDISLKTGEEIGYAVEHFTNTIHTASYRNTNHALNHQQPINCTFQSNFDKKYKIKGICENAGKKLATLLTKDCTTRLLQS